MAAWDFLHEHLRPWIKATFKKQTRFHGDTHLGCRSLHPVERREEEMLTPLTQKSHTNPLGCQVAVVELRAGENFHYKRPL